MGFRSTFGRFGVVGFSLATSASFGLFSASVASADSVDPFQSDYGNIDVFTTGDQYIGVNVSNFRLMGDNSTPQASRWNVGAIEQGNTRNNQAVGLAVSDDGNGQAAFVGPLTNGTYNFSLNCDVRAADGKLIGRGQNDLPSNPVASGFVVVHMNGKATRANVYAGLPLASDGPDFHPGPLPAPASTPDVNDIEADMAKGESCARQLSGDLENVPPGTKAALEVLHKLPKNASNYAYAACALSTLASSPNPADGQDVFNSICKGLENAADPLGIGAAKDFFCGTPVG